MIPSRRRRWALLCSAALVMLLALGAALLRIRHDVQGALALVPRSSQALQYVPVAPPSLKLEHWGGGAVEAVAVDATNLWTAGGFGIRDAGGDLSEGLPTLHVAALALWRGRPVAAPSAGGLFLRREGRWEEARSGFGTLHVRTLVEGPGGELFIGSREGLYRAAWGATVLDRLDPAPVRSLALGEAGLLLAAGEEGLRRIEAGRAQVIPTPDPWVDWVGLEGRELAVLTPLGLATATLDSPHGEALHPEFTPVRGTGGARTACRSGGRIYAVADRALLRIEASGRASEERLASVPQRVFASAGLVFADTEEGLYRRTAEGWTLARPRPASLPPGPSHVTALAALEDRVVAGLFDGGLVMAKAGPAAPKGDPSGWACVPGTEAWGVNALLPSGGALYVASLRGAARFDGHRLEPIEASGAGAAYALAATRDGVAIGYGHGVLLPGSRFLSAFHGLPGNQALALASGDQLFVGTPSGLGAIGGSRVLWRVAAGEGRLPHPWITALASRDEGLYVGTYGGGVALRQQPRPGDPSVGRWEAFPETQGFKVNTGCLVACGGRLYLGTDGRGLYRLSADGRRFEPLSLPLPSPRVTALLATPGALYVGTEEGLAKVPFSALKEGA